MKRKLKTVLGSALLATAFLSVAAGMTYALFTDRADTKIDVVAGIVDIEQDIVIKKVASLNADDEGTEKLSDTSATFANGGSVSVTGEAGARTVKIEKLTPGDKVVLNISNVNKSNVLIKSRFLETHTTTTNPDLYKALDIKYVAKDKDGNDITHKFMEWELLEAATDAEGYAISTIEVTIEFVNHDEGILPREEGIDNPYQYSNCAITFTQQAVQGNAAVKSRLAEINAVLAASTKDNKTMYDAVNELGVSASTLQGYVWDSQTDRFAYLEEVEPSARYFKYYSAMPSSEDQEFSIYADFENVPEVNLYAVGFDAGNTAGIEEVNYQGSTAGQSVIIRTNGGDLVIDAANDDVYHYGVSDKVSILAVAGNSYHEAATVNGFIEINQGHIAFDAEETYLVKVNSPLVTADKAEGAEVIVYAESAIQNSVKENFDVEEVYLANALHTSSTVADLEAFLEAVNMGQMGKPVIYLDGGEYQFTKTFDLTSTVSIIGIPGETTVKGFLNPEAKEKDVCAFNIKPTEANQTFKISGLNVVDFGIYKEEGVMLERNQHVISGIFANAPVTTTTYIENCKFEGCGDNQLRLVGGTYYVEGCMFDASKQSYEAPNVVQVNGNPYKSEDRATNAHIKDCHFLGLKQFEGAEFSPTALSAYAESHLWVDGATFEDCNVPMWVFQTQPYHGAPVLEEFKDIKVINCDYICYVDLYLASTADLPDPIDAYETKTDSGYTVYYIEKTVGGVTVGYSYYIK